MDGYEYILEHGQRRKGLQPAFQEVAFLKKILGKPFFKAGKWTKMSWKETLHPKSVTRVQQLYHNCYI